MVNCCAEQELFKEKGLQLEVMCSPAALHVEADAVRLAQVVGNLLHNAAKFTLTGGGARLTVAKDEAKQSAVISIKDSGMGIEPEMLSSIFVPFMQADTSLDRGQSGLGLGLALVKCLAELHGGEVTAYSGGPGKGSEFTIRLPLLGEQTTAEAPEVIPSKPGCSRRVLVVKVNSIDIDKELFVLK